MEPARSTDEFSRKITASDNNNIVTVLDLAIINSEYQIFEQDYKVTFQVALEDVKCTVGLFSLAPAPFPEVNALMSEAAKNAEIAKVQTEGQKIALGLYTAKGNGPWTYKARIVLQNQGGDENHVPLLVPHLGTNETLLVGGTFKLGVKVEPIWNQPLKAQDYIVVSGTYKQVVSFSSKKKDDIEQLNARIEALELALAGRLTGVPAGTVLGRNTGTGTVELIPQTQFAKPADIDAAINTLVGNSSTALDTLAELGAALANDGAFATTIANALSAKAPLNNPNFTGVIGTQGQIQFPSVQIPSTNPRILDDYEEGVFTPSAIGTTLAGEVTYTTRTGTFTKIGKRVFYELFVEWTEHTGTGGLRITGLPYISGNNCCSVWHRNLSLLANHTLQANFLIISNAIVISLGQVPAGGGAIVGVSVDSAAGIMINGSYLAAT